MLQEELMSKDKNSPIERDFQSIAIASAEHELIQRYGSAGSQFLVGLRGIDYETGQKFDRSLLKISRGSLNPDYYEQNLKQQAGFSAEVISVSKRNAESIIKKEAPRFARSEDIAKYGKNHNIVDIVELIDDKEITSQMKFVTNQEKLLDSIACGKGKAKDFSRYLEADKIEVPSEQVDHMKDICRKKIRSLTKQSNALREQGNTELADLKQSQAQNYEKLERKIKDSGLSTEEAINYRKNPAMMTNKDILNTSHKAGIEGLKLGIAIGGSISVVTNVIAFYAGDKEFSEAMLDASKDTLIAGATGYATAASGTAIKTYMSQSSQSLVRSISKSNMPAMVMSACLSTSKSIKKYAVGAINEEQLAQEIGVSITGMISASMFTIVGQVAIPVPMLGGLIGGMVGYALTNTFYQSFFDVLKDEKLSVERRQLIEMQCESAKMLAKEYELKIKELFAYRIKELEKYSNAMFTALDDPDISPDAFCIAMNRFAEELGTNISINNMAELEEAIISDQPLTI